MMANDIQAAFLVYILLTTAAATYLPWNGHKASRFADEKENTADENPTSHRRSRAFFKDDAEIYRYLKIHGRQLMLWRCKNAIQPYWRHRPLPFIDLYCDVIGAIQSATWSHKGQHIASTGGNSVPFHGGRYQHRVSTHYEDGWYYAAWLDFRLRIYNATERDSGVYRFRVKSPDGDRDEQMVFVDISSASSSSLSHVTLEKKSKHKKHRKKLDLQKDHRSSLFDV